MPPYDPFADPALSWAIVRVVAIDPPAPTWARPAIVRVELERSLRGEHPSTMDVRFGPPREAGQSYFYAQRDVSPLDVEELARRRAALDAQGIEVPEIGSRVVMWLAPSPDGTWDVPTLRSLGAPVPEGMRSRWLPADEATLAVVRARLG